ncbi:MAG TPA: TetR/AcrR family transcriptional regulator [Ktedonobacteraceae bacterium]
MSSTRERLIETVCTLLEVQGYHATGLKQILSESGAPKGSLYYHFPQGKEELAEEAVMRSAGIVADRIRQVLARSEHVGLAVQGFVREIAEQIERSNFSSGGPLTTIALETVHSSQRLNSACRNAYHLIQEAFAEKLAASGYPEAQTRQVAPFIVASIEGAILLSRTNHSGDPLRQVADALRLFFDRIPIPREPLREQTTHFQVQEDF